MTKEYFIKLGISMRIPMSFKRFCNKEHHKLIEEKPNNYLELSNEDKKISLTYYIVGKGDEKIASFHPSGEYECFDEDFRQIFDKIIEDLNYAAYKANEAQDMLDKRMTEEFERNLRDKSDKSGKFPL